MISPSVALSLWLAVWGLQSSQPPPPTPSLAAQIKQEIGSDKSAQSKDENSPANPNAATINQRSTEPAEQEAEDCCNTYDKEPPNKWEGVWSCLVAIFTGVLAVVACLQWGTLKRQAGFMEAGLEDTKKSADAAKQSADALIILNRSRLRIDSVKFIDVENSAVATFRTTRNVTNVGPTTAHVFEQFDSCWTSGEELPENPPYGQPLSEDYWISPEGVINWKGDPMLKSNYQIDKVLIGEKKFYAYGFVRYLDEFGVKHETRYAYLFRLVGELPTLVTKPGYNSAT